MSNAATAAFTVKSSNFDFHEPIPADTYAEALEIARKRGFQAAILHNGTLVAAWCPLYGTRVYNRELAGLPPGLKPIA